MSILRVRLVGEQILRKRCVEVLNLDTIQRTIDDMLETVRTDSRAVALAAPQVGIQQRFFVFWEDHGKPLIYVNPVIEEMVGWVHGLEGCLSIPEFFPVVQRAERVRGRALNRWGDPIEFDEDGLLGRAIQHETDHLDGRLMLDLLSPDEKIALLRALPPELHRIRKGLRAALAQSR